MVKNQWLLHFSEENVHTRAIFWQPRLNTNIFRGFVPVGGVARSLAFANTRASLYRVHHVRGIIIKQEQC